MVSTEGIEVVVGQRYQTKAGIAEIKGTEKSGKTILFIVNCDWHEPILLSAKEISHLVANKAWSLITD